MVHRPNEQLNVFLLTQLFAHLLNCLVNLLYQGNYFLVEIAQDNC